MTTSVKISQCYRHSYNKCDAGLPLLLALCFCFVQINIPKLFFPQIGLVLGFYWPFTNRKWNANQLGNAAICIAVMCRSFSWKRRPRCPSTYDLSCGGGVHLTFIATFWMEAWYCYFSLHPLLDLFDHMLPRDPQFLRSPFVSSKNTILINIDTRGGSVGS